MDSLNRRTAQAVVKQATSCRTRNGTFQLCVSTISSSPRRPKRNMQMDNRLIGLKLLSWLSPRFSCRICGRVGGSTPCIWRRVLMLLCPCSCSLCCYVCKHLSAGFSGNSSVDLPIVSHNLVFCRWDVQTYSMPPCSFFLSPVSADGGTDDHPLNPLLSLILLS